MSRAAFIGRWQTIPLHEGHHWLINQALEKDLPVLIMVRDTERDIKNPYPAEVIARHIEDEYADRDVKVIVIPDISSVNYGRDVGYSIIEHIPPTNIRNISATKIRNKNV